MRKTRYLLEPLAKSGKKVVYYAIDLEEGSLHAALKEMSSEFPSITFIGLLGTYDEGLDYLATIPSNGSPRCVLWLGSSIGNMTRPQAADFFKDVSSKVMSSGDIFLCGIDKRNDPDVVSRAYNDSQLLTNEFIMNGLDAINNIFGQAVFDRSKFEYLSIYNNVLGRHEAYYRSLADQVILADAFEPVEIVKGELINIEYSYKYSQAEVAELSIESGLPHVHAWCDSSNRYQIHLFQKSPFYLHGLNKGTRVPSLEEFQELWKSWYVFTNS